MNRAVFLDAGIFIAFLNRRDRWHAQAITLFSGRTPRWCTSVLVISETYSWFLHRMGEEAARIFRQTIENLDGLTVLETTRDHHEEVGRALDTYRGSKLTYVDASSLALIAQHDIEEVWSTDHHLSLGGATLRPRS